MENKNFKIDSSLLLIVTMLLVIGVVMVYSASSFKALQAYHDSHHFFKNHFFRVLAGLILMLVVAHINYRFWLNISPLLLLVSFCMLVYLLLSPSVPVIRGSRRWLPMGPVMFQASDFARLALVLFLSLSLGVSNFVRPKSIRSFAFHLGIIGFIVVPILLQPDAGTAVLITFIALTILFIAGERLWYLFVLACGALPVLALILLKNPYQWARIIKFIDALKGERVHWQVGQSLIAFGNGSLFGQGLGSGQQKYDFLPDPFTDFIFAIVGEELGLIGTTIVLALITILIWNCFKLAQNAPDFQGKILGAGVALNIGIYALTNMGVVLGLLPTTGIPMPFLSYGGSALMVNMFFIGILMNIAEQSRMRSQWRPVRSHSNRRRVSVRHA